jgi:cytochrome c-type biogenesis protein
MGNLLTTGSLLAAFFAGGVALFAPCCIVFLLPSYMAAAVKNRRWRLLPLTFAFAAGLALVLVPITVGISLVAATISKYHIVFYWAGGLLMFALAAFSLSGRMWSLPRFLRAPDATRGDTASMFALGAFSGVASSCCAPVLAGVMTLSALSGSTIGATTLGLAYVFGMVFPLFAMALLWDRLRLGERRLIKARPVRLRIAGRTLVTNTVNVAVAIVFAVMGGFIIYLAQSERMTGGPGFQAGFGRFLGRVFGQIETWVRPIPEAVLGLGLLALAAVFVLAMLTDRRRKAARPDATAGAAAGPDPDEPAELSAAPAPQTAEGAAVDASDRPVAAGRHSCH